MSTNFVLFSNLHILTLLIVIFTAYTLPTIYKNKDQKSKDFMSKTIAFIVLAHVISSPFKDLYFLENPYNWREVLPFHMCDLSEIFIAWFLLGGPKILFNCAFFWGLAGASMAMLTPDISFYDLDYLYFYIGHGMIVVAVMYAVIALKNIISLNKEQNWLINFLNNKKSSINFEPNFLNGFKELRYDDFFFEDKIQCLSKCKPCIEI